MAPASARSSSATSTFDLPGVCCCWTALRLPQQMSAPWQRPSRLASDHPPQGCLRCCWWEASASFSDLGDPGMAACCLQLLQCCCWAVLMPQRAVLVMQCRQGTAMRAMGAPTSDPHLPSAVHRPLVAALQSRDLPTPPGHTCQSFTLLPIATYNSMHRAVIDFEQNMNASLVVLYFQKSLQVRMTGIVERCSEKKVSEGRRGGGGTFTANMPRRSASEHQTRSVSVATARALAGGRAQTVRML